MAKRKPTLKQTAKIESPHAIYANLRAGWEWRVLKTYQTPANEQKGSYPRWFVAARSPMTYGSFEYGDTYRQFALSFGRLVAASDLWCESYGIARDSISTIEEYLSNETTDNR